MLLSIDGRFDLHPNERIQLAMALDIAKFDLAFKGVAGHLARLDTDVGVQFSRFLVQCMPLLDAHRMEGGFRLSKPIACTDPRGRRFRALSDSVLDIKRGVVMDWVFFVPDAETGEMGEVRFFFWFESQEMLADLMDMVPRSLRYCHEVILPGVPCRIVFDVDLNYEEAGISSNDQRLLEHAYITILCETAQQLLRDSGGVVGEWWSDWTIYGTVNPRKFSRHVVSERYYCERLSEMGNFAAAVRLRMRTHPEYLKRPDLFDRVMVDGIYHSRHELRMMYSARRYEGPVKLRYVWDSTLEHHIPGASRFDGDLFAASLLTAFDRTKFRELVFADESDVDAARAAAAGKRRCVMPRMLASYDAASTADMIARSSRFRDLLGRVPSERVAALIGEITANPYLIKYFDLESVKTLSFDPGRLAINLRRRAPGHCIVCTDPLDATGRRMHSSNGAYLAFARNDNWIYVRFHCRAAGAHEHDRPPLIASMDVSEYVVDTDTELEKSPPRKPKQTQKQQRLLTGMRVELGNTTGFAGRIPKHTDGSPCPAVDVPKAPLQRSRSATPSHVSDSLTTSPGSVCSAVTSSNTSRVDVDCHSLPCVRLSHLSNDSRSQTASQCLSRNSDVVDPVQSVGVYRPSSRSQTFVTHHPTSSGRGRPVSHQEQRDILDHSMRLAVMDRSGGNKKKARVAVKHVIDGVGQSVAEELVAWRRLEHEAAERAQHIRKEMDSRRMAGALHDELARFQKREATQLHKKRAAEKEVQMLLAQGSKDMTNGSRAAMDLLNARASTERAEEYRANRRAERESLE